jgi:IS30 family transposase
MCLRSRRKVRKSAGRNQHDRRRLGAFKSIDDRPLSVLKRVEVGHWEGDLMCGSMNRSAVVTLVERVTRLTLVAALGAGSRSQGVRDAVIEQLGALPASFRRTLTWDQGIEMSLWNDIEKALGLDVFFCHPRSPWERPTNENTNRQLRYWLPRNIDLSKAHQRQLDRAMTVLNTTPRRSLGWATAQEEYVRVAVH